MWDPIFELNSNNPPEMCDVSTTSGSSCTFPFNYNGITYKTCTIFGPNNGNFRPQCAITVNSNRTAVTWSFCQVPTDAVIFYSTVRKGGYWTQNGGSTQGGTMIWIYGNRFAQNGFNSVPSITNTNTVQLVDSYSVYDCEMHNDKTTNTQLTCYAPSLPESLYQIRVSVNGNLIPLYQYYDSNRALFSSMPSQTPTITGIQPQSGTPQSLITLTGSFKTSCYSRDIEGCAQDNNPLISRIYVGGHLCNVIDQSTGSIYTNVTSTSLTCKFEDNEVGLFNISMIVTNEYGRSLTSSNLYRVSADENLYTFQSYAVISNVMPNSGSTQGGTILTISGNYFSNSATYPLVVKIGGEPCTVLSSTTTTIQCQTPVAPQGSQSQYQGGRGLQIFRTSGSTAQSALSSSNPPAPTGNASWTDDALFVSSSSSAETVWLIGFIRLPKTATYTFILDTNGNAALFLSTDDSPTNKVNIATATSTQSTPISLNNNTNYYLFCVGSRSSGYLRLGIQARMHATALTAKTSSLILNEIQRIDVTSNATSEQQQITYTVSASNGTSEVQSLQVDNSIFQIGFRGVYTAIQNGRPTAVAIQTALNDLPTISPLTVSVSATSTLYMITFPAAMGDVPLLTCISTSPNTPNITEVVQGIDSGSKIAFELDGQLTDYIDFINSNLTQADLYPIINNLFSIQCPPSINNAKLTTSIVYLEDFETNCIYDETPITTNAFCGQCSLNGNTLINNNNKTGNYLCFAYRILNSYVISIDMGIQINGDTTTTLWPSISFSPKSDKLWHYTCIDIRARLLSQSSIDSTVSSIVITYAWLNKNIKNSIYIDTVSIRTALPQGYEDINTYPIDQSINSSCVFPFYYNGNSYPACTLDNNSRPICADINNGTYQCKSSSIEGVRRLYPKHQLSYNTLQVAYSSINSQITTNFRYSDCVRPTRFVSWASSSATITSLSTASDEASGTFDLVFNSQTYASIPVSISATDLANQLQASSDFGYLNVKRSGDCTGYSYVIEWIANGGQKSAISITNAGSVLPSGTTVTATVVQSGGVLFKPLSGDMTRTYQTNPQVEVFVGGFPSQCSSNSTCDFQWLSSQTPTVTSIVQSSMTLTITGTGFSTIPSSNTVIIGTSGSCTVTSATTTSLLCTIAAAPSGTYNVQVNVAGKGLASSTSNFTATISLQVTSISPIQGGAGGGYTINVTGTGFSSSSSVTIGGNLCTDPIISNFSLITCTVPPTTVLTNTQVSVVVTSDSNTATSSTQFTYDVTNTPSITSVSPNVVTMSAGQLTITGTNFGSNSISVLIGTTKAQVQSISSTQIIANLPSLAPGLYSIRVITTNGYARPALQIEYRFYVQTVEPQIGSLYGGSDIYVQGEGFDNTTTVSFTDGSNDDISCNVISFQSNQIHCRTENVAPRVIISSNGVDPTYGSGFAWSPQFATVEQGAIVEWQWGSSALLTTLSYKVQQVTSGYSTTPSSGGFDSGNATASGSFSYQFQNTGTYYYWTPAVDQSGLIVMRGVINVVAAQPRTLTVKVSSRSFTAQSCAFPFTFNSVTYTACTTNNDTQLWCSPTSTYTGQRLYCTPNATVPSSTCVSSLLINPSSCSQTVPSNVLKVLFTPCTIGTVTSISPVQGPTGTTITITGTGFSTTTCENIVLIGSSYQCPISSASTTQIVCQIGSNSLLNGKSIQSFNIIRDRQGFLSNNGLIQFQFQAKITNVSPLQGSIVGGTQVTITGDGFIPDDTRVIVGSIEYTSLATITYSQIQFITQQPPSSYIDQTIPIRILIGTNQAVCSSGSCTFNWTRSVTPYLTSVSPTSINGPQTLTLTGQNLEATGSISSANTHVTVDGQPCNVTSVSNSSITCAIGNTQVGNYSIVASIDGVGTAVSSPIITSIATISNVSPTSGSTYGGVLLTINGNGFARLSSNIQVTIGSSTCSIVETTPGQVQCIVPTQGSNTSPATIHVISNGVTFPGSFTFTYNSGVTPTITSIIPTSGTAGQTLTISGSNFVSGQTSVSIGGTTCTIVSVSSSSITCTISSSPAGSQPVIVSVSSVGKSNSNIQFQYTLQVNSISPSRGSYGGGQLVTVNGDGFNTSSISVTICSQSCQSISVLSNTQLTCVTPSASYSATDQSCSLTVTVGSLSQNITYVYQSSLTATITSISPTRGGTGGGTSLAITGTNFPTSSNSVTVSIAGVSCSIQTVSSTSITCLTGSYSQTTVQAPVIVSIVNGGNAIGSAQFQYIDLWSSPWTWGGDSPPDEGTIVSIDSGKTVYFDTTTPIIKAIVIDNASLIFDDNQDVALNAEYILVVNGGRLQIGTETNPFQHKAVITMYGHLRSIELPIFGAKVLALREGIVDMHGRNVVRTWARLASTAAAGSTQITLLQNVDWSVGSQIVIATTGDYLSQGQSEIRTITAISSNGLTLTLDSALTYSHLGVTRNVGSTSVEIRAEVGLLSHNVIFQGSTTSTWNTTIEACPTGFNPGEFAVQTCFLGRYGEEIGSDQFGATIMASSNMDDISDGVQHVILRLSNIEVFNGGQAFRLGRYPVHFHMNGNMSLSYIKSSSIHQTFNRAVNIHASHYLTVENNVIYNIMGGAMFLEDGIEVGNILRGNLAVFVRTSSSLLNEDVTPAAFWVTNPNNIVEHNAVAGGTHFGYWYRMLRTPDGPSFALYPSSCPYRHPFGRFFNNSVHSVGRFGVWFFPEYSPTVAGSCTSDAPYQAIVDGLVSWKNNRGIEWVMSSTVQIRNTIVFDNHDTGIRCVTAINHQATDLPNLRSTFYNENNGSSVINSIIIGDTGVSGSSVVPGEGGLVVMWDRGLRVRNVTFVNFTSSNTQAIYGPIITGRCLIYCGGWLTKFSQLSFVNVQNRGNFRWSYDGLYQDEDGTLSNVAGGIVMSPDGLWNTSSACTSTPNFPNAVTCPSSVGKWIRFAFNKANLGANGEVLNIYDTSNRHTVVLNLPKRLTHPIGYMMNLLTRQTYLFQFQNANSSVNLSYSGVVYDLAPGDHLIVLHNVDYMPDRVNTISATTFTAISSAPLTTASNNGDWYYDNSTHIFSYIVKNPSSNTVSIDVSLALNVVKCRYPNCETPAQPGLELPATARPDDALYWSNDSDWSFALEGYGGYGSVKPSDDTNIYIPRGIWLVVDYPLPRIRSLRIDGVLEFEQGINNTLYVDSILINGGQLIVGWPNDPLTSNVDIIINGSSSVNVLLPNDAGSIGPRVIGVLGGLDLHGISHNVSWTRLATTALAGQNSITLSEPVDWVVGNEIILTTTDTRIEHVERHTIASIGGGGTTITLVNNLAYTHIVIHNVFPNGQMYHVAGAVGLLTRNVRVINRSPASEKFGFRILVTDYATNVWNPVGSEYLYTYYKGYARLSNAQFIGYGQFVDAPNYDKREAIHLYNLGDWNISRPTYVDSCSFDTGYYSAIGIWDTNGVPVTGNVVYNTYESAIVVAGQNNIIQKNLVSTVYWSGVAQPEYAEFNTNNDGAIMSRDAVSVIMKDNLVSGAQRLCYRIQGNACPGTVLPTGMSNDYDNNEAHSAMSGVNIWPMDLGFDYDTSCVLFKGFKTYKTWYYGLYINTAHNIIIDSCQVADSSVGIFTLVIGPPATSHQFGNNSITIRNSIVAGAITQNDCSDTPDSTTLSEQYGSKAIPLVSATSSSGNSGGRTGITFPYFSRDNMMPSHPWTGIGAYPTLAGIMTITNVTFGFFNDICSRRDIAIQVSQNNDDGQHPVVTSQISVYNTSTSNLIFNGRPNLAAVNPSDCVDMDCDGLKKSLLTDTDGTLFGLPSTVFSEAEYLWGNQAHGVGDFRIPSAALANLNGTMLNINNSYPGRGISRSSSCIYQPSYQMYLCRNTTDYRMLIIESMDSDTETRRLSPVAIMSDNGFIDLINGPQDHGWCNGYTCQKRISTFMALVEANHHYDIYLSSTTPEHMRFRLLNADSSIRTSLALYYNSLQQIDVYANDVYVEPTNRAQNFSFLMLLDQPSGITYASRPGSNYFNRTTQMASFIIDGVTVINLKISELIVLTFGLPATTPSSFYTSNIVASLASLLGVSTDKIRRVNIVSANTDTRIRRQTLISTVMLRVEIRDEPPQNINNDTNTSSIFISDCNSDVINRYHSGELQVAWANDPVLSVTTVISLGVQEPGNQTTVSLSVVSRLALVTPPSSCRLQSVCDVQPVLVAYDSSGNIIEKLGSNDQPWQVVGTIVGSPGVDAIGAIANYSNGQTQFTSFGITAIGSYQIQFAFITPSGVSSSFVANANLIVGSSSISVSDPILAVAQYVNVDVVSKNETFNLTTTIVDKISKTQIGNITWSTFTWSAAVSLYSSFQYQSNGSLITTSSSRIIVDPAVGTITATDLAISEIGMYIIKLQITSSNGVYSFPFTSNGILVKENSTVLKVFTGFPTSNITYNVDYDSYVANGQLEILRATIYNYLYFVVKLPITSNIVLVKGSTVGVVELESDTLGSTQALGLGLSTMLANPNAISDGPVSSINFLGRSYTVSSSSSSSSSSDGSNIGLIVGLVVGLVGGTIVIVGIIFGFYQLQLKNKGLRLVNNVEEVNSYPNQLGRNNENTTSPVRPVDDGSHLIRRTSITSPTPSNFDSNRLHSPLSNDANEKRAPSASVSITMLGPMSSAAQTRPCTPMSAVELIKLD
ncbi:unnamed protein product [Rotaria sordida]|uniref:Fibrocystin-L n=1 Tax=Rotaria sordida TaxID=392033 RepID=A0A818MP97_9BILA|nr:unnamed protein product [Rotaria sordida]